MRTALFTLISLTALSSSAFAFGLQVADTAEVKETGRLELTMGAAFGELTTPAARLTYSITPQARAFAEAGFALWEEDDAVYASGGLFYVLPEIPRVPVPLAARLSYSRGFFSEDVSFWDINLMAVTSLDFEPFTVYGGVGFNYNKHALGGVTVDAPGRRSSSVRGRDRKSWDPALSAGAFYRFEKVKALAAYAELTYIGEPYVGAGVRIGF